MFQMSCTQPGEEPPAELASKEAIVQMFLHSFMHENALNPLVFPSLRQFEVETVAMVADMLHGNHGCVGSITSGGTESILMAVKTYRDRARKLFPHIINPEIVSLLAPLKHLDMSHRFFKFLECLHNIVVVTGCFKDGASSI